MKERLFKEMAHFRDLSKNARDLLKSFTFFEVTIFIASVFTGAFLWSGTSDLATLTLYYAANYLTLPVIFHINGLLSRRIRVRYLFIFGIILAALSPLVLVSLPIINNLVVGLLGILFGIGNGFYWSNRNYLSQNATEDTNRNYFFSIAGMLMVLAGILVPALSGLLVVNINQILQSSNAGYIVLMAIGLVFSIVGAAFIWDNKFPIAPKDRKIFIPRLDRRWNIVRVFTYFSNFHHGLSFYLGTILVLTLIGNEDELGLIESLAALASAVFVYITGRLIPAHKRNLMLLLGVVLFVAGAMSIGLFYTALAVVVYRVLYSISNPQRFAAISAIWAKEIDRLNKDTGHADEYAYYCDLEVVISATRLSAIFIFLAIYSLTSTQTAVQLIAFLMAFSQIMVYLIYQWLRKDGID